MEVIGQLHIPASLSVGKATCPHFIGGWMGTKAYLDAVAKKEKSFPCQESNSGRSARSIATILKRKLWNK